jgi:hypothetical protein
MELRMLHPLGVSGPCVLLALCSGVADLRAQTYMNDGSSTYRDSWASSSYIYGYGSTAGNVSIHRYSVDVTITSPLGRTITTSSGSYRSGTVSTTASLSWNYNDFGDYYIRSTHKAFCTLTFYYFVLRILGGPEQPPGPPPCRQGEPNSATCTESNTEIPWGKRNQLTCTESTNCCTALDLQPIRGWCRTERCNKCSTQTIYPLHSACYGSKSTCENVTIDAFCRDQCQ